MQPSSEQLNAWKDAALRLDRFALEELMAHGVSLETRFDTDSRNNTTALLHFCERESFEGVEWALSHGADIFARDNEGAGVVWLLSRAPERFAPLLKRVLAQGAPGLDEHSWTGDTPLVGAMGDGNYAMAEVLMEAGADLCLATKDGWDPETCIRAFGDKKMSQLYYHHKSLRESQSLAGATLPSSKPASLRRF